MMESTFCLRETFDESNLFDERDFQIPNFNFKWFPVIIIAYVIYRKRLLNIKSRSTI